MLRELQTVQTLIRLLGAVWSWSALCPGLSVWKLEIIIVNSMWNCPLADQLLYRYSSMKTKVLGNSKLILGKQRKLLYTNRTTTGARTYNISRSLRLFIHELCYSVHKLLIESMHSISLWRDIYGNRSRDMTKQTKWLCAQRRVRSAWAFAQSDQSSLSAWRKLGSLATH